MGMQSLGQAMMRQDEIDQRQALLVEERRRSEEQWDKRFGMQQDALNARANQQQVAAIARQNSADPFIQNPGMFTDEQWGKFAQPPQGPVEVGATSAGDGMARASLASRMAGMLPKGPEQAPWIHTPEGQEARLDYATKLAEIDRGEGGSKKNPAWDEIPAEHPMNPYSWPVSRGSLEKEHLAAAKGGPLRPFTYPAWVGGGMAGQTVHMKESTWSKAIKDFSAPPPEDKASDRRYEMLQPGVGGNNFDVPMMRSSVERDLLTQNKPQSDLINEKLRILQYEFENPGPDTNLEKLERDKEFWLFQNENPRPSKSKVDDQIEFYQYKLDNPKPGDDQSSLQDRMDYWMFMRENPMGKAGSGEKDEPVGDRLFTMPGTGTEVQVRDTDVANYEQKYGIDKGYSDLDEGPGYDWLETGPGSDYANIHAGVMAELNDTLTQDEFGTFSYDSNTGSNWLRESWGQDQYNKPQFFDKGKPGYNGFKKFIAPKLAKKTGDTNADGERLAGFNDISVKALSTYAKDAEMNISELINDMEGLDEYQKKVAILELEDGVDIVFYQGLDNGDVIAFTADGKVYDQGIR